MDYIRSERHLGDSKKTIRRSALFRINDRLKQVADYHGLQLQLDEDNYGGTDFMYSSISAGDKIEGLLYIETIYNLNLLPFFEMMEKMENYFGKPQYFEWVMVIEKKKPVFYLVQIADVNKRVDTVEFEDFGKPIFQAHSVIGSGIKDCTKIVTCHDSEEIDLLRQFNRENKGYVLIFSGNLTSTRDRLSGKITYSDFNQAAVLLERLHRFQTGNPISHFGGPPELTDKLFAILDDSPEAQPAWGLLREKNKYGLFEFQGKIRVVGSERKNRLVVFVEE